MRTAPPLLPSQPNWELPVQPDWLLDEQASASPWPVRMTAAAADKLLAQTLDGELETGGWLFGKASARDGFLICDLIPAVSEQGRSRVVLDFDELRRVADLHGDELSILGNWHSHPASDEAKPSRRDLSAYLEMSDALAAAGSGHPALGVIVTQGRSQGLRAMAFIVGRRDSGEPDCVIAPVELPPRGILPSDLERETAARSERSEGWNVEAMGVPSDGGRWSYYSLKWRRGRNGDLEFCDFQPPDVDQAWLTETWKRRRVSGRTA
jgi:hypothetical protein